MSAKEIPETEHVLIGSILEGDESEESNPRIVPYKIQQQGMQSDSIIENMSSEKNYFDSFNKSFDYMSLGSDQGGSPISPHYQMIYGRNEDRQNSCHSFDGPSFSTQENSFQRWGEQNLNQNQNRKQKRFQSYGFVKLPMKQQQQDKHRTNIPSNFSNNWQPMAEINDDIQLSNDLDNMCGNQLLSRKIQKIFEQGKNDQRELIFSKVERSCVQFSKDVFGNYLIQRILERGINLQHLGTNQQMQKLFNKIRPHIYELAKNNFGCRVVQKITEIICNDQTMITQFLGQIQNQSKSLLYDSYGNFVILKCLETLPYERMEFITKPVEESVVYLCSQPYGCKIILKILELYQNESILQNCLNNQKALYQQEFGNHILQYAIHIPKYLGQMANFIIPNFEFLCINKYSSNTVEKLVEQLINQRIITQTLIQRSILNNQYVFVNISLDPFGNYVMKKFLIMSDRQQVEPILRIIRNDLQLITAIRCSEYGQRIYLILEKMISETS